MQRPDGSFRHLYDVTSRTPDDKAEQPYYSGEAGLALARMHTITGDVRQGVAAESALDWYDFFLAGLFYGEARWTYNTPAGSRTEAMISAHLLGKHHGSPALRIVRPIRAALAFALRQQLRPYSDYDVVGKAVGDGARPATPIDRNVRIDYVQHVCSAMIRASEWIDRDPWPPNETPDRRPALVGCEWCQKTSGPR